MRVFSRLSLWRLQRDDTRGYVQRVFVSFLRFLIQFFFFSSRRRHTRYWRDWSSDMCSSDLKTKDFPGMKVPVKVEVDTETKKFTVEVGIPPTAALVAKEAGIAKGSGTSGTNYAGDLPMASAVKIAKMKIDGSYAKDLRGAVKEVIGSCVSMGVKVEGKPAKEVYADISAGKDRKS